MKIHWMDDIWTPQYDFNVDINVQLKFVPDIEINEDKLIEFTKDQEYELYDFGSDENQD